MVSTFHLSARDFINSRSRLSDADGFGTIKCRQRKYQPYIQVMIAIGAMKITAPTISITFLVRNFTVE